MIGKLAMCKALRVLYLGSGTYKTLEPLRKLSKMEIFAAFGNSTNSNAGVFRLQNSVLKTLVSYWSRLKSLSFIEVEGPTSDFLKDSLKVLAPRLESLTIQDCATVEKLPQLHKLTALKTLDLSLSMSRKAAKSLVTSSSGIKWSALGGNVTEIRIHYWAEFTVKDFDGLVEACPLVQIFDMSSKTKHFDLGESRYISEMLETGTRGNFWGGLTQLHVAHSNITDRILGAILRANMRLEVLGLECCNRLTFGIVDILARRGAADAAPVRCVSLGRMPSKVEENSVRCPYARKAVAFIPALVDQLPGLELLLMAALRRRGS